MSDQESGLREVTVQLESLRRLLDERDRRYEERFVSAKEAVAKAEAAQTAYNTQHNDLTRKMEQQRSEMVPRQEAEMRFKTVEEKIAGLRESRSESKGGKEQTNWLLTIAIGIAGLIIGYLSRK